MMGYLRERARGMNLCRSSQNFGAGGSNDMNILHAGYTIKNNGATGFVWLSNKAYRTSTFTIVLPSMPG
jgi:hypothetical protein